MKKEALLYEKLDNDAVHCYLCAHHCRIARSQFGFCGVRQNIDGVLYTHVYGEVAALNVDPIEKKPLFHFLPGTQSLSFATIGCNFRCGFCQNWQISQESVRDASTLRAQKLSPEDIVQAAVKNACKSISYTYTEPTIFFEYALDTAKYARARGLYNNFVTNGYMTGGALRMIAPYLDSANVDLKAFREGSYKKVCAARLKPVLDSIKLMKQLGIWVEVTTLIVPGFNDSREELRDIAQFVAEVDKSIPWHISRFHPDYQFTENEATPEKTLKSAEQLGHKAGLQFVYVGNAYGWGSDTYCPDCKKLLVKREGFSILENNIYSGACAYCHSRIPGVFT
ncbi:MAG: AmmeMemoRadiSam system radical SAM enzyme [Candidatus Omnitrophota bacterium]